MRSPLRRLFYIVTLLALGSFLPASQCEAASVGKDNKTEYPYQLVEIDGKLFRFCKQSGKLEPLGAAKLPSSPKVKDNKQDTRTPALSAPKQPKNRPPQFLEIDGNTAEAPIDPNEVPEQVTDRHRKLAKADLARYRRHLGIIQSVHVKDGMLDGTLAVTNKGDRKLLALEVSLVIPVGNEKKVHQHYLLSYASGKDNPPQPATKEGRRPEPVFLKVECPAPTGIKGKIDTQVTYIMFAKD